MISLRATLLPAVLTGVLATLLPSVTVAAQSTETDPPVVLAVQPARDAIDVDPAANVSVDFSEPMDAATLTTTSITLTTVGSTTPLPAAITYDSAHNRATLDPDSPLSTATTYTATVLGGPSGARDLAGNPLAVDEIWSFTTAAPADTTAPETTIAAAADAAGNPEPSAAAATGTVDTQAPASNTSPAASPSTAQAETSTLAESSTVAESSTTVTFAPVADARVEAANPNTNFGSVTPLRVDSSPIEESFLKFDVTGTAAPVTSAKLRLYVTNATINGPTVFLTGNDWTEAGLTWNNRPAQIGTATDDLGNVAVNTWAEFDVTPLVSGDGTVSFNLGRTSSDAIWFNSREVTDPALRPQLVVTFTGTPPPPVPPTVAATPPGGTYTTAQSVTLTASEPATIRYTTDGSDPTASSAVYTAPLALTASTTLKFFAVTPDGRNSGIVTEAYTIQLPATVSFAPAADARVEAGHATVNYGTATSLVVDSSPQTESYLRFDVSGLTSAVQTATLRLFVFNDTSNGPAVYTADNTWTETGITWNNRPPRSLNGVDDKGALPVNAWADFDVTPLISGNGTFTLVLATSSSDAASFYAKEWTDATLRPQLVVTSAPGVAPTVSATPAGGTFSTPVDVTLSASKPATIHYTIDGSNPTPSSPTYAGPIHLIQSTTLKFIGIDSAGATSAVATETYTINADFTPPATTIASGPADPTNLASATFTFSSDEPGSTFACALDGAAFTTCSSPKTYSGLTAGSHMFQVRAIDLAGNVDPTPAATTWTIDLTAPTVTSVAPAAGATGVDPTATVSAVFSEDMNPVTLSGSTVRLVPQGSGSPVSATVTYDAPSRTVTLVPATILTVGATYTATVVGRAGGAADRAGNPLASDKTWSFSVRTASTAVTFTVNPVADAWVDSTTPATNYGTATSLTADTSPASQSYLRFSLSGITAPVRSAKLRLYAFTATNNGPAAFAAGSGWTETGVTWNNRPATIGNALDHVATIASQTWVEYNVTSAITGNGTFDLALVPMSSDGINFYARENAVTRPELVVTFGGPPPPTVAATPAGGTYPGPVNVTLTASEPATIRYTTDGSTPNTTSPTYTAPVPVQWSSTLNFYAVTSDGRTSPVVTETYSIDLTGYRDFSFGSASAPTAKEGQSKVWYAGGAWFAAMFQPSVGDFHIFRLNTTTQTWTDTGTLIDARNTARVDALWDGAKLYTVSVVYSTASSARAELRRFSYSGGVYTLDSNFPVVLNGTGAEMVVMDKASDGTLWVTYATGGRVYVIHSLSSDRSWTAPFTVPGPEAVVSTTTTEASSVIAFGNSIGVMWSNQVDNKMYFGVHPNGAPDSSWSIEVAYGVPGQESADNHINLKADSSGRVYGAVKSSLNATGEPLINLVVRQPAGGWSTYVWGTAEYNHTRPVVVLDEQAGRVHVFASAPCCAGGIVYHKSSSMSNISFPSGPGTPVIASKTDTEINNVSSTKQSVTAATGLLIIAGDDMSNFYLHNLIDPS